MCKQVLGNSEWGALNSGFMDWKKLKGVVFELALGEQARV